MPKDKNNGREMTPDEKFRSFFSTTAVDIPEEMTRRDENQPEEKPQKRFGLFGRGKEKQETDEAAAEQPQEMPTGEVRLGEDAQPEPEADLELMLKPEADPEQEHFIFTILLYVKVIDAFTCFNGLGEYNLLIIHVCAHFLF